MHEFIAAAPDSKTVGELLAYFRIKEIKTKGAAGEEQVKMTLSFNVANKHMDGNDNLDPRRMYRVIGWAMENVSGDLKTGPAPRGELERVVEKYVQDRGGNRRR